MPNLWRRVSRQQPCPICGKSDWCRLSHDLQWAICRRLNTGEGRQKVDKSGVEFWIYHLQGDVVADRPRLDLPTPITSARAEPVILNQVYHAILHCLSLSADHRAQLRCRGFSDQEISARAYRSLPRQGRAAIAKRLLDTFGPATCSGIPGLYICEGEGRRWWSLAGASGLIIPIRDHIGRIVALSARGDDPDTDSRYSVISSTRYRGPGPGAPIHVPLMNTSAARGIRPTEGALKADVATASSGLWTLGLPRVSGWSKAISCLWMLKIVDIHLAFDMDAYRNLQVALALRKAALALQAEGFRVHLELWDEADGKGIDDLLAAGHTPTVLTGSAMIGELGSIIRSAKFVDSLQVARRWAEKQQRYTRRLRLSMAEEVAHVDD